MTTINKQANFVIRKTENVTSVHKPLSAARVWDRFAERYAKKPIADPQAYAHKLAITREYLHAEANVLELGCGTGSTALVHAPYVKHLRAVDFSAKMIGIANDKADAEKIRNVDFVCGDATNEFSSRAQYDVVLALSLLHLLPNWRSAIKSAHGLLKPGGVFITSTPCLNNLKILRLILRLIAPLGHRLGVIPQLVFFSREELENAMSETGFGVERAWQPSSKAAVFFVARRAS